MAGSGVTGFTRDEAKRGGGVFHAGVSSGELGVDTAMGKELQRPPHLGLGGAGGKSGMLQRVLDAEASERNHFTVVVRKMIQ